MSNNTVNRKFTAIYNETWQVGSHTSFLTHMQRIEQMDGESIEDMLKRECIEKETVFLFCGHPLLHGEKE